MVAFVPVRDVIANLGVQALAHAKNGLGAIAVFALLGGVLTFAGQALLARLMSPDDVGYFGSIIALATLLAPIGGAGVYGVWLQMFPRNEAASSWIRPGIIASLLATTFLMTLLAAWGYVTNGISGAILCFLIGSQLATFVALELNSGSLQVRAKYTKFAFYQAWPQALRLIVLGICAASWAYYSPSSKLLGFAIGHFVFSLTVIVICATELHAFSIATRELDLNNDHQICRRTLSEVLGHGWPFVANTVLLAIYSQITVIIAAYNLSYTDAAIYLAANAVVAAGYIVIGLMYRRYFQPRMFKLIEDDPNAYVEFARKGLPVSIGLGFLLAVGVAMGASLLLTPIFGQPYGKAVGIVHILSVTVLFRCIINHMGTTFVRKEEVVYRSRTQLMGLIITIPAMFFLSTRFGLSGLAWSCVLFDLFLVAAFYPRYARTLNREIENARRH